MSSSSPEEKYSLLFTLPKSTTIVFTSYVILLVILSSLSLVTKVLNKQLALIFFGLGILQIFLVKHIGGYIVPYSSVRRITSAEICALIPLLLILLVELFYQKITLLYVALAFSISFRLVIYYGAFFDKISISLLVSILPLLPFFVAMRNFSNIIPILILISITLFLLQRLDEVSKNRVGEKTTSLFRYFMSAWVSEYPLPLERFLERNSEKIETKTYSIILEGENSKPIRIVIPYVHPGPFKPVGSYNLPYEIKKSFPDENVIVLHAPVDHKFNIPSHSELHSFLRTIKEHHEQVSGTKMSLPKGVKSTNFEIFAIGILNDYRLIIINPITPCEDFPPNFLEALDAEEKTIIVDAHNNLGPKPDGSKVKEAQNAIRKITPDFEWQNEFLVGHSHVEPWNSEDIGPGGADCVTISFKGGKRFSFIVFDANNIKSNLVKRLTSDLSENVIILTTDSHFNAAKMTVEKGYKALGEETPYHELLKMCKTLISSSVNDLKPAKIKLAEHKVKVKVLGERTLLRIADTLNTSLSFFKKFWIVLLSITLVLFLLFGLVNI